MSKLIMSMSGTRGIIGDSLTPQVALEIAMAYGTFLKKGPVIIGGDTRVSHDMIKFAVISGLTSVGCNIIDIGRVPTPTVQQLIRHHKASGGMVITASHNPIMWNGIKMMNNEGAFLSSEEHQAFTSHYQKKEFPVVGWEKVGTITKDDNAIQTHIDKITSKIDISTIKNAPLKVLIDVNNGTGAIADPMLFDELGIQYDLMGAEPNGKFEHTPEPVKENLTAIVDRLKQGGYDIGFVQDPDADRLVILDEAGNYIGEDYGLAYCIDYILSKDNSLDKKVVVNLSTSMVTEHVAKKHGATVHYTKIGEPNVTKGLKDLNGIVGGEGNGGVIYPTVGWGRDSLVGIVIALKHLVESKKKVSETIATYPKYQLIRDKFEVKNRTEIDTFLKKVEDTFKGEKIDKQDGVKVIFDNAWVHARPSNTEPIVRIFGEASSENEAKTLLQKVYKK